MRVPFFVWPAPCPDKDKRGRFHRPWPVYRLPGCFAEQLIIGEVVRLGLAFFVAFKYKLRLPAAASAFYHFQLSHKRLAEPVLKSSNGPMRPLPNSACTSSGCNLWLAMYLFSLNLQSADVHS